MAAANVPLTSLLPLIVVAITQVLLAFNVTSLKISIDAIVDSYDAPASVVKSALIVYSLAVASCILVGAKVAPRFGSRRVFRATIAMFAFAMLAIVLSTDALTMIIAQMIAGVAAAVLVPTLVLLIADNYADEHRPKVLSWVSAVRSLSLAPAFLVAGMLATWSSWRVAFALMLALAIVAFYLGSKLSAISSRSDVDIDAIGFVLTLLAVILIGIGFDNLTSWGVWQARPDAPFSVLQLSPAPFAIALGVMLLKGLVVWSQRCRAEGRAALISPEVISVSQERLTLFAIFTIGAVSAAVTFLIPLYIEIVQGRNSLHTALAMIPFTLSSVTAAVLIGRLHNDKYLRLIARYGFLIVAAGLVLLGATVRNDWSDITVIFSMIVAGLGEGVLATLLLRLLMADAPAEYLGDVDPLCSAASHLAAAVGTALAGALVIGLLSMTVHRDLAGNPEVAEGLREHLNLDRVSFVSNDQLRKVLESTAATPEQVSEAVRINTEARLRALKVSFFALAGLALLAFIPSVHLPNHGERSKSLLDKLKRQEPFGHEPL